MNIKLKDERLGKRWRILVRSQMKVASPLAAGVGVLPSPTQAFAATQAAWRFYNNERVTLAELVEPLREYVRERVASSSAPFVLVAHDWSKLSFPGHASRRDMAELSSATDMGYEVTASLAIAGGHGAPLGPVELHLKTKDAFLSTRQVAPPPVAHLEQILPTMEASLGWRLGRPIVHVIDREADSVGHWRPWIGGGHTLLIRADERVVLCDERRVKLSAIRKERHATGQYRDAGPALYHGRKARLRVAETTVVRDRPARTMIDKKQVSVPGPPLTMRLILTRVEDEHGTLLAEWYLLSNVPAEWADAAHLARCYYWRWRIETDFKLLQSHGLQHVLRTRGGEKRWTRLQAAPEPRPATGRLAAGNRTGPGPPPVGGVDGLCDRLAPVGRRFGPRHRTEKRADPPERPPNETHAPPHRPRLAGRSVDAAGNVRHPRNP